MFVVTTFHVNFSVALPHLLPQMKGRRGSCSPLPLSPATLFQLDLPSYYVGTVEYDECLRNENVPERNLIIRRFAGHALLERKNYHSITNRYQLFCPMTSTLNFYTRLTSYN